MSGAKTHYRSYGMHECASVEEHCVREEAVSKEAVDFTEERMPE